MNICYFRVSKEDEKEQDLDAQIEAVLEKFNLSEKDVIIYKERGSAYNLDKLSKRKEFLELIDKIFNANKTTIKDLFLQRMKASEGINLYVWDYHRIMRNFEYNLLFGLLSDFFRVKIFSYKQGAIKEKENETPLEKFSRYIFYSINAFSSEDYSYNISTNIKKVVKKDSGITVSTKGNKWGKRFRDVSGEPVELDVETVKKLNKRIVNLIGFYERKRFKYYYNEIIEKIKKEYNIKISKAYITGLRK